MPEWQVEAQFPELAAVLYGRKGGEVTDVLPRLLGAPPVYLDQFLEELSEQFRPQAASA